jgi:hypothetical protein
LVWNRLSCQCVSSPRRRRRSVAGGKVIVSSSSHLIRLIPGCGGWDQITSSPQWFRLTSALCQLQSLNCSWRWWWVIWGLRVAPAGWWLMKYACLD